MGRGWVPRGCKSSMGSVDEHSQIGSERAPPWRCELEIPGTAGADRVQEWGIASVRSKAGLRLRLGAAGDVASGAREYKGGEWGSVQVSGRA